MIRDAEDFAPSRVSRHVYEIYVWGIYDALVYVHDPG